MFLRPFTRRIWPRGCWLEKAPLWMLKNQCCRSWNTVSLIHHCVTSSHTTHTRCKMNDREEILTLNAYWLVTLLLFSSECGAAFTSKLEGMFKDMELSKDIMVQFKQVRTATVGSAVMSCYELRGSFHFILTNSKSSQLKINWLSLW